MQRRRGGCFLAVRPDPARLGRAVGRPWEYTANCPHGGARASLLATDSPLTAAWYAPRGSYSGEAAIPKRPHQEGTVAPPRSQSRFVVDLSVWCIQGPDGTWNGVGLSPVSVIGHCEQARPPYTPRTGGKNRDGLLQDGCSAAARCFSTTGSLARHTRPDCGPSRSVLAWPLRHRPLLDGAGCVPLRGRVRARISGRARPRPGRIRPSFRIAAPFETEPITPAAHASCRAGCNDFIPRKDRMPARSTCMFISPPPSRGGGTLVRVVARRSFGLLRFDLLMQIDPSASSPRAGYILRP